MRFSAAEEYGLRCLIALAREGADSQISITDIAEREGLSVAYVTKLLWTLRKAGLVDAARGRTGGFRIARPAEKITLYESLTVLGGPLIDPEHCQKHGGQLDECVHAGNCSLFTMLGSLAGFMRQVLSTTTLADMVGTKGHTAFAKAMHDAAASGRIRSN
jgi:Rrf2 family protein